MLATILAGLLAGGFGGLLGGAIVALTRRDGPRGLWPADRIQRPVPARLAGRWRVAFDEAAGSRSIEPSGVLSLTEIGGRDGGRLSGRFDRAAGLPGSGHGWLAATYADGILTALFDDGDPTTIARGALVVRLLGHGDRMRGHLVLAGGPGAPPRVLACELVRLRDAEHAGDATRAETSERHGETPPAAEPAEPAEPDQDVDTDAPRTPSRAGSEHAGDASGEPASDPAGAPARAVWRPAPGRSPGAGAADSEPSGHREPPRVIDRARWTRQAQGPDSADGGSG